MFEPLLGLLTRGDAAATLGLRWNCGGNRHASDSAQTVMGPRSNPFGKSGTRSVPLPRLLPDEGSPFPEGIDSDLRPPSAEGGYRA